MVEVPKYEKHIDGNVNGEEEEMADTVEQWNLLQKNASKPSEYGQLLDGMLNVDWVYLGMIDPFDVVLPRRDLHRYSSTLVQYCITNNPIKPHIAITKCFAALLFCWLCFLIAASSAGE